MLECNRLNGRRQVGGIDESQDTYKNKWTNNVNSSGIQIEPGDTITCEAIARWNLRSKKIGTVILIINVVCRWRIT